MNKEKQELIEKTTKKFMQLKSEFHRGYIIGYMTAVMSEHEEEEKKTA